MPNGDFSANNAENLHNQSLPNYHPFIYDYDSQILLRKRNYKVHGASGSILLRKLNLPATTYQE